ncbi:hypothetical protein BpHYR1_012047 [Brachionus plicatilis]|uniref:Uncharacterized protein n=1 Tax=Brachionus plicatilis TaxID=10195 RepID=A0A3M7SVY1_BRAPC|nr:hypothetical protein BpHYR1_012047 [Brachionus plicatilis]
MKVFFYSLIVIFTEEKLQTNNCDSSKKNMLFSEQIFNAGLDGSLLHSHLLICFSSNKLVKVPLSPALACKLLVNIFGGSVTLVLAKVVPSFSNLLLLNPISFQIFSQNDSSSSSASSCASGAGRLRLFARSLSDSHLKVCMLRLVPISH